MATAAALRLVIPVTAIATAVAVGVIAWSTQDPVAVYTAAIASVGLVLAIRALVDEAQPVTLELGLSQNHEEVVFAVVNRGKRPVVVSEVGFVYRPRGAPEVTRPASDWVYSMTINGRYASGPVLPARLEVGDLGEFELKATHFVRSLTLRGDLPIAAWVRVAGISRPVRVELPELVAEKLDDLAGWPALFAPTFPQDTYGTEVWPAAGDAPRRRREDA